MGTDKESDFVELSCILEAPIGPEKGGVGVRISGSELGVRTAEDGTGVDARGPPES